MSRGNLAARVTFHRPALEETQTKSSCGNARDPSRPNIQRAQEGHWGLQMITIVCAFLSRHSISTRSLNQLNPTKADHRYALMSSALPRLPGYMKSIFVFAAPTIKMQ